MDGICEAMNGSTPISPNIVRKILEAFKKKKSSKEFNLSPRETELLQLLLKGYSLKMVSTQLKIPFDTGRSHLTNIYQKLHVNFAGEAIASKLKEKII